MSSFSHIASSSLIFLLTGVPALEVARGWISIPFCCLYVMVLCGNGIVLFVVITESSLCEPVYCILSMLSTTNLCLSISTLITMLGIFWYNTSRISFHACIAQTFFIQLFTVMESSVLPAMAVDHFITICNPLRYATILTDSRIIKMWFAILFRETVVVLPLALLLKCLFCCRSHVLHHSYCFHPDIIQLSCSDNKINSVLGLTALVVTAEMDSIFILLSYTPIIKTVLSITSPEERHKAFSTCISHVSVAIFCIPLTSLCFVHRFAKKAPPYIHTLMVNVCLLVPPVMSPIIYGVKAKQIHKAFQKVLFNKRPKA